MDLADTIGLLPGFSTTVMEVGRYFGMLRHRVLETVLRSKPGARLDDRIVLLQPVTQIARTPDVQRSV
jgi:hypothetical protein